MRVAKCFLGLLMILSASAGIAEERLVQGYWPTRWGDSAREVKAALAPLRMLKEVKQKTGEFYSAIYEESGKPPIATITYFFAFDQLWKVEVKLVPELELLVASAALSHKYLNNQEVADELRRAGVDVRAAGSDGGVVVTYTVKSILDEALARYRLDKARDTGLLDSL